MRAHIVGCGLGEQAREIDARAIESSERQRRLGDGDRRLARPGDLAEQPLAGRAVEKSLGDGFLGAPFADPSPDGIRLYERSRDNYNSFLKLTNFTTDTACKIGFILGGLQLIGFIAGALLGSRLGPLLLSGGSSSPYAPIFTLAGAVILGSLCAALLERAGFALKMAVRLPGLHMADSVLGAILLDGGGTPQHRLGEAADRP